MPIAQLSIDLVAKMAEFEKDLKRTTQLTQQQASMMASAADAAKGAVIGLGGAFSIGFAVDFVKRTINSVDALNDLRDATGASIENASALEDIAARTGASMDTVTTAVVKLNAVLKDAKPGSDAAAAFKALGLSAEELKAMDPAEALLKTATAFAKFADDGDKARVGQELFGKTWKQIAAYMVDLAEAGKLVATVTTQQAAEAEKFNKQLFNLQKTVQDTSRTVVGSWLPSLIQMNEEMVAGIKISGGFFNAVTLIGTTNPFNNASENLAKYRKELEGLQSQRKGMSFIEANATGKFVDKEIEDAKKRVAYFKILQANEALLSSDQSKAETHRLTGATGEKPGIGGLPDKPQKHHQTEAEKYLITLQKQLATTQELTTVQTLGMAIVEGRLGKMTVAEQNNLVLLAQKIDTTKAATKTEEDAAKATEEDFQALLKVIEIRGKATESMRKYQQAYLLEITGAGQGAQARSDQAGRDRLNAEFKDQPAVLATALANYEKYLSDSQAIRMNWELGAKEGLSNYVTENENIYASMSQTVTRAFNGMEDSLVSFVKTGKLDFSSMADSIITDLIRIQVQQSITIPLSKQMQKGLDGLIGAFFNADGGVYNSPSLSAYSGGVYNSPKAFKFASGVGIFAEAGPEAIMPLKRGADGKLGVAATGGTSAPYQPITININATVGDIASKSDVVAGMRATANQIAGQIQRSKNYGGALV